MAAVEWQEDLDVVLTVPLEGRRRGMSGLAQPPGGTNDSSWGQDFCSGDLEVGTQVLVQMRIQELPVVKQTEDHSVCTTGALGYS